MMRFGSMLLILNQTVIIHTSLNFKLVVFGLLFLIGFNDTCREKYFKKGNSIGFMLSYLLSNAIYAFLSVILMCDGTRLYSIVLIIDLIFTHEKISIPLMAVNVLAYGIPYKINIVPVLNRNILVIAVNYFLSFMVINIMRSLSIEKARANKLSEEFKIANEKLKEYSKKIEELTISEERTRIAQELHDSMGHSLIALNMNLEFAEQVIDLKPEKAKESIVKSHSISKDCIGILRKVVTVLKDDTTIESLHDQVLKLFQNFTDSEMYHFYFNMSDEIENEPQNIKSCIYVLIMESLTNGMKHGKADSFHIDIKNEQDTILVRIQNNGLGCPDIIKSNGLKGMEKRISDIKGIVRLYSEADPGFVVEARIPTGGTKA
ncbi:MAG: Sensory transduction protein kinase [Lacrimispora sp.]|nr:Sensory transduction protein kinase [Lacrimispora sp.]